MKLARVEYAAPTSIVEAVALLGSRDAKILAGGQSLMPLLAFRLAAPDVLVDLKHVPGLDAITIGADGVRLGAKVRWCDIEADRRLLSAHPLLVEAVTHVAHYQIRNRGTVGGSLAHADPAAELPGVVVACDAVLTLVGGSGERTVAGADFFEGALQTSLAADEMIVDVLLPPWLAERRWAFQEFARRRGDYALAGVATFYDVDAQGRVANAHLAVIGVGDHARRLVNAEAALNGRALTPETILAAAAAARAEVDPPSDIHAPADYRRALVATLVERALAHAAR